MIMSRKNQFALTTVSFLCIVSASIGGSLWSTQSCCEFLCYAQLSAESILKGPDSTLTYPKFLQLVQAGSNGSCDKVLIAPGNPVFEVNLKDYSVRKVWVPRETKEKVLILLNQKDIPIWVPCRK